MEVEGTTSTRTASPRSALASRGCSAYEQELSVLCLRVLQAALVYVNTLMVQDVLADDDWAAQLTDADRRGLTPLFWTHVAPVRRGQARHEQPPAAERMTDAGAGLSGPRPMAAG
ncbi:MAG: transposase [Actinomycetota bacterium]|nr:transposase [Actinomycetota bacterium]